MARIYDHLCDCWYFVKDNVLELAALYLIVLLLVRTW